MEFKGIQSIDGSLFPHYCNGNLAKRYYDFYEVKASLNTISAGVVEKLGLKPGEEWKTFAGRCKSSVEEVVAEMDEFGVKYALLIAGKIWSQRDFGLWMDYNVETVVEMIKKSGGRFVGAASYNPFRIIESLREIDLGVREHGFKYVWFHPISFGLRPDDRRCYPLYSKCLELGIPVGMQTGHSAEPLTSEPGHPMAVDNVALEFPELKIILTHTGWPWVAEWVSMVRRHANVFGMINAYYPSQVDPEVVRFAGSRIGRDKVVWGSHGMGLSRWMKEFSEFQLSDETRLKILRDNPNKVFRLT
jgi:uncharacterized protein